MKVIDNFLDEKTISMAYAELQQLRGKSCWNVSLNGWDTNLHAKSIIGSVTSAFVGEELRRRVVNAITPYIPRPFRDPVIQHYLWHPLSGINMHDDRDHGFGATIYLTPEWDVNWGGLFIYTPTNTTHDLKVVYPTYNSININTEKITHCVTTVSPLAPRPRYTLQIWGYYDN